VLARPADEQRLGVRVCARYRHGHRAHTPATGEDRERSLEPAPPADGVGRGVPAGVVILSALVIAGATLAVGFLLAFFLRSLPTVRVQLAGLAALAVGLPLISVLFSGWVMFHMGDDVKILAVSAASAASAVVAGLFLASAVLRPLAPVRSSAGAVAPRDLTPP